MSTVLANRRNGNGVARHAAPTTVRVAVYCRVSTTERLGQEFNSLDNQQAMCEAFIASQAAARWEAIPALYHDGGFTGANTERPALRRLLADVEAGRVDVVLVYRLDRLTRSMRDFFQIVDVLEQHSAAFASVSESFNTNTPVGRMVLHVVLAFAQMERELTSERTKDKIRGAKRRGQWCGGCAVFGYDIVEKKLVPNEIEAHRVREAFRIYLETSSLIATAEEMNRRGWRTKESRTNDGRTRGGKDWNKGVLHGLLTNPILIGKVVSGGEAFAGNHPAIVDEATWTAVQARLESNGGPHTRCERHPSNSVLGGLLRCPLCSSTMTATFARKGARRYEYLACSKRQKGGKSACPAPYVSAPKIESEFVAEIARHATDPKLVEAVVCAARDQLGERKRALSDEARSIRRAIKDAERVDFESDPRRDSRIAELRARIAKIEAERAALEATVVDVGKVGALLREDFGSVWEAMTTRERRLAIERTIRRTSADRSARAPGYAQPMITTQP